MVVLFQRQGRPLPLAIGRPGKDPAAVGDHPGGPRHNHRWLRVTQANRQISADVDDLRPGGIGHVDTRQTLHERSQMLLIEETRRGEKCQNEARHKQQTPQLAEVDDLAKVELVGLHDRFMPHRLDQFGRDIGLGFVGACELGIRHEQRGQFRMLGLDFERDQQWIVRLEVPQPFVPQNPAQNHHVDAQQQQAEVGRQPDLKKDSPIDQEVQHDHDDQPNQKSRRSAQMIIPPLLPPGLRQLVFNRNCLAVYHGSFLH